MTGIALIAGSRRFFQHLESIHTGHGQVEQHYIRAPAAQHAQRSWSIRDLHDLIATLIGFEMAREQMQFIFLVVDDQDCF